MKNNKAAELIARCFEARTKSHFFHLQTKSYSQHKAFNQFYDEIVTKADSFAEAYQGRNGIISDYPSVKFEGRNVEMIEELREWIDKNRQLCGDFSELQNAIDEIVSLCDSTIYKLRNLS
ncbi:MAG: DUF5856 family protein [Bacilli bacterium]|nr:DUF5856 family protein [Bacilli bacterium]